MSPIFLLIRSIFRHTTGIFPWSDPIRFSTGITTCASSAAGASAYAREIRGVGAIAFLNRSHGARIGTAFDISHLEGGCRFCGACVDVCPTGALTDKGTKWRPEADTQTRTTCFFCGVGCSIKTESRWNIVTATRPDENGPANKGQACVKGRFCVAPVVNHANRLKFPLIKKDGVLTPVEWDEAIAFVADGLKRYAPGEIGFVASSYLTNEAAFLMQKLARTVVGSPNIDNTSRPVGPGCRRAFSRRRKGIGHRHYRRH